MAQTWLREHPARRNAHRVRYSHTEKTIHVVRKDQSSLILKVY